MNFKSKIFGVLFSVSALSGTASAADVFLGYTVSLADCQVLAGQHGYPLAGFGGYVNGVFYTNACFGKTQNGGIGAGKFFDVTPYDSSTAGIRSCIRHIEREVAGVKCRQLRHSTFFECRGPAQAKYDISYVRCVEDVAGPYNTGN